MKINRLHKLIQNFIFVNMLSFILVFSVFSSIFQQSKQTPETASFTFQVGLKKHFTLTSPSNYLHPKRNLLSRLFKSSPELEESGWYYIRLINHDISKLRSVIPVQSSDMILKDTFLLYLTREQLEALSEVTLIVPLEPKDKIYDDEVPYEEAEALAVSVKEGLILEPHPSLYSIRDNISNIYKVRINKNGLTQKAYAKKINEVAHELAKIPHVRSVSTIRLPKLKNSMMTGFTQKNTRTFSKDSATGIFTSPRYLNNLGIDGRDEIVAIIDSPVDPFHQMFYDSSVSFKTNTDLAGHRKLVYYGYPGSASSTVSGMENQEHGTHVAGTVAGQSACSPDYKNTALFNGNAPNAKILYAGLLNNIEGDELVTKMNRYNSKISTNSWGTEGFSSAMNYQYGQISYQNPDKLFLFAAGNEFAGGTYYSVCDPGGSKNVLTVGAMDDLYESTHSSQFSCGNGASETLRELLPGDPWVIGTLGSNSFITYLDLSRSTSCSAIENHLTIVYSSNPNKPVGNLISPLNNCDLEKSGGIFASFENNPPILQCNGRTVSMKDVTPLNPTKSFQQAEYSSAGPANKGVMKPDLMGPGTRIISARSSADQTVHGCRDKEIDFTFMQGTSMATPNIAGAAALVRHYFRTKWPKATNVDLNGPTVRALLINSATHPKGSQMPDYNYGHGIVDLSTVLPFDDEFGVAITPQGMTAPNSKGSTLDEASPSLRENSAVEAQIIVDTGKPLQITMSYLDPILSQNSPYPLTRDLELVVFTPSNEVLHGDNMTYGSGSTRRIDGQHMSTNEKVIISNPQAGTYRIRVYSGPFSDPENTPQQFSVVATGKIENQYLTFTPVITCGTNNCDPQRPVYQNCAGENTGPLCDTPLYEVQVTKDTFTLEPHEIQRVYFNSPQVIKSVTASSTESTKDTTIFVSRDCHYGLNEYEVTGTSDGSSFFSSSSTTRVNFNSNQVCVAIFNNNPKTNTFTVEVSEKENGPGSNKTGMIVGIVIGIIALIAVALIVCVCCKKRMSGGFAAVA